MTDRVSRILVLLVLHVVGYFALPVSSGTSDNRTQSGIEDRYHGLLEGLQSVINQHKASSKTSNAGIAPWSRVDLSSNYPGKPVRHCADIKSAGHERSGVYVIQPPGLRPLKVLCDMDKRGGGWTVFQKRFNGAVDFYRDWLEYRRGFGDVETEYWLGLDNLYVLTHTSPMELLVYLEDFDGNSRYAYYDSFAISSEFTKYRLDIGSYSGTAGDALIEHRDEHFSTKDQDNDSHSSNCAVSYKGAWWYNGCYRSSLNGEYLQGQRSDHKGTAWRTWRDKYSLKTTTMMIRPVYQN